MKLNLYVNSKGSSQLSEWTSDDLMKGMRQAESDGDDFSFYAMLDEVKRRKLHIVDATICGESSKNAP